MLNFFSKLVKTLTLSRVFIYTLAVMLAIVAFTVYESRSVLFSRATKFSEINPVGLTFSVSEETERVVTQRVDNDPDIIGMGILSVDLRLNETESIFYYGDDATLNTINNQLVNTTNSSLPLFTAIEESNNNVINLINGEFGCLPFEATLLSRIYPELNSHVKMVCQASIPSYYGYFSGYINIFLDKNLSVEKQDVLRNGVNKLATEVYFRDVIPTQRLKKLGPTK